MLKLILGNFLEPLGYDFVLNPSTSLSNVSKL